MVDPFILSEDEDIMSGLRYILLVGFFALLAGVYLGEGLNDDDSRARNAGLEDPHIAPTR